MACLPVYKGKKYNSNVVDICIKVFKEEKFKFKS